MKRILPKSVSNLIFIASLCVIAGGPVVQAADNLNIVFTTTNPGGEYGDRHIHVVWLANTSGTFVSTAGTNVGNERTVWANARRESFATWWTSARQEDIDARTGATQTSYKTYDINWNFKKLDGSIIPDGTYRLYFECTNEDSGNIRNFTYFTITKGESAWNTGPTSQGGYNNVTLTFTPAGLGVENTGATDVTSTSARLNGQVTGTFGENPEVFVYWGDNDGGTTAENWDHEISLSTMGEVPFYTDISGLSYGGEYYYRCYVRDSTTGVWAVSTESFEAVTVAVVFEEGDIWSYFKGYSTPDGWNGLDFDDGEWLSGPTGIGYGDGDDNTELEDMEDHYLTVYMRYEFNVDYPADVSSLIFTVDYDDGFVAFINGHEVARSENMPEGQNRNTEANPDHEAGSPEVIDLSEHAFRLVAGENVFAIEVHNTGLSSSDLSMIPELVMTGGVGEPQSNIGLDPDTLDFTRVDIGSQSDLTFDIRSIGPLPLYVNSLEVVGFDKAAYSLVSPPALPLTLPELTGIQTITTRFAPTAARAYNYASVAIGSDDPDEPAALISLRGEGFALPQKSLSVSGSVGGTSNAVALSDNYAIIGQGATLTILDTSDPCDPAAVGQVRLDDVIQRLAVLGDMAYAAGGSSGLMPVEIDDLFSPVALESIDTPGFAYDVAASGSTLCVADGPSGLAVYDISAPNQPTLRINYQTQGSATAVELIATTAYLLDDQLGLQILDVAGTTAALLGSCDKIELGRALALSGTSALITDSLGNFFVVDVSNLATPVLLGQTRLAGRGRSISVMSLQYYDAAFVASGETGIQGVLLSNPAAPLPLGVHDTPGQASDLAVSGSQICVADGTAGIEILNVTDAFAPPTQLGAYQLQSSPYAAAADGAQVHVAAGDSGLHAMDLSSPDAPVLLAVLDTMLEADIDRNNVVNFFDVARLANNWLAAGALLEGDIYADGVVNPRDVAKLAADWLSSDALDEVRDVEISGTIAYLANGRSGFQIVDISSPSAPALLGDYATAAPACSVAVNASTAIVADGLSVYLLDIANPLSPSLIGQWASNGWAHGVAIDGSYGYVANGSRGLQVLNLADASSAGSYDTPGVAFALTVADDVAYIADGRAGVQILDITAPAAPSFMARFETGGSAVGATVVGSYLYVADGSGICAIDVSTPASPALYARSNAPVRSLAAAISGSQIIVADNKGGLVILDVTDYVAQPPGAASTPNPPHGSPAVSTTPLLSWEPGAGATSHDVYFGTTNPPEFQGNQTTTTFQPGSLSNNHTYYWRIDEVNENGTTTGPVWTFVTELGGGR